MEVVRPPPQEKFIRIVVVKDMFHKHILLFCAKFRQGSLCIPSKNNKKEGLRQMYQKKLMCKRAIVTALSLTLAASSCLSSGMAVSAKKTGSVSCGKKLTVQSGSKKSIKVKKRKGVKIRKKTYKSSNKKVASVSKKGVVAGKKAGKCKITVTVKYKKGNKLRKKKMKISVVVTNKIVNTQQKNGLVAAPTPSRKPTVPMENLSVNEPTSIPDSGTAASPTSEPANEPTSVPTHEPEVPDKDELLNYEKDGVVVENGVLVAAPKEAEKVKIPEGTKVIQESLFKQAALTTIEIPASCEIIENNAFESCTSLTAVTIPANVSEIGDYAFKDCTSMTTFVIENQAAKVGQGVVEGCTALEAAEIPVSSESCTHDYAQKVLTEPTCEQNGLIRYICGNCGVMYLDSVPKLGHHYEVQSEIDSDCTKEGVQNRKCTRCNKTQTVAVSAKGHTESQDYITDEEATCTSTGQESKHCTKCGCIIPGTIQTVEALGHNYNETFTVDKEPTCTESGMKSRHCSRCSAVTENTIIPAAGHTYSEEYETVKQATCTEPGTKRCQCVNCEEYKTVAITALGHDYSDTYTVDKEPTCTESGMKSKHCSRCSAVTENTVIPAAGHTYSGTYEVVENATCTKTGTKRCKCQNCDTYKTVTIAALGHNYSETFTVDKEPTCTESGTKSKHCSRCSAVAESTTISPLGHMWTSWQSYTDSTCYAAGSDRRECSRCKKAEFRDKALAEHGYSDMLGARINSDGSLTYEAVCPNGSHATSHNYTVTVPDYDFITDGDDTFNLTYFEAHNFIIITGIYPANPAVSNTVSGSKVLTWINTYFPNNHVWLVDDGDFTGISKTALAQYLTSNGKTGGVVYSSDMTK